MWTYYSRIFRLYQSHSQTGQFWEQCWCTLVSFLVSQSKGISGSDCAQLHIFQENQSGDPLWHEGDSKVLDLGHVCFLKVQGTTTFVYGNRKASHHNLPRYFSTTCTCATQGEGSVYSAHTHAAMQQLPWQQNVLGGAVHSAHIHAALQQLPWNKNGFGRGWRGEWLIIRSKTNFKNIQSPLFIGNCVGIRNIK